MATYELTVGPDSDGFGYCFKILKDKKELTLSYNYGTYSKVSETFDTREEAEKEGTELLEEILDREARKKEPWKVVYTVEEED